MRVQLSECRVMHPMAGAQSPAALDGLSLTIQPGEKVAIIGPSGAGKTSFLHLLSCFLKPESGRLMLGDTDPWSLGSKQLQYFRSQLFLAPQTPPLPPRQRVVTAVLAGCLPGWGFWKSMRSLVKPTDLAVAFDALQQFDLGEKLFMRVDRLSGGERQRVGLARTLVSDAQMLLIDEPLSALDPARSNQAMETLLRNAQARNATLVATLHQVDMALKYFPRIIGLADGKLRFDLPASDVTEQKLQDLYAQHPDELHGPAPCPEPLIVTRPDAPVCR